MKCLESKEPGERVAVFWPEKIASHVRMHFRGEAEHFLLPPSMAAFFAQLHEGDVELQNSTLC